MKSSAVAMKMIGLVVLAAPFLRDQRNRAGRTDRTRQ